MDALTQALLISMKMLKTLLNNGTPTIKNSDIDLNRYVKNKYFSILYIYLPFNNEY